LSTIDPIPRPDTEADDRRRRHRGRYESGLDTQKADKASISTNACELPRHPTSQPIVAEDGRPKWILPAATPMISAMSAVLVSLIAVAGTLLGSFTTYLFQRRTALHAEAVARNERLRQDRLAACGAFAAAITEVKRAVITAWFRRNIQDDEWRAAMTEADRVGATAEGAFVRMLLLTDDVDLRRLADAVSAQIAALRAATDKAELEGHEVEFAEARAAFISASRRIIT
jgi:hypothetical protein